MLWLRLRSSEWLFTAFFAYIVLIEPFFRDRENLKAQPPLLLAAVFGLFCLLARMGGSVAVSRIRDWLPLGLTLVAFREMELFLPPHFDHAYEAVWIGWDRLVLEQWKLRPLIESCGPFWPGFLELCYFLVYGTGFFCIGILYGANRRNRVDLFFVIYLIGTLGAYALFPFFPSQPPRIVFPSIDPPQIVTALRRLNLFILQKGTIHVGVFPSAHVSSAFASAWAMFLIFGRKSRAAWGLLAYSICVSLATVYGRYHYAADVAAGFGVSLLAGLACLIRMRAQAPFAEQ